MGKSSKPPRPAEHYSHTVLLVKKPNKIRKKRASERQPAYLTEDERTRLFAAIRAGKSTRDFALFSLMFHHGLRASEPALLTIDDYVRGPALTMDRLRITRKKGSVCGETVVVEACARAIRSWLRQRGFKPGPLFPSRQKNGISRGRVFALMVQYGKVAGLPDRKLHPHCLKHSCAIDLANYQKESVLEIRAHLGHSSINSTMRYVRLLDQAGEARAKRLAGWR